jgi:serine O-acetyltransferase
MNKTIKESYFASVKRRDPSARHWLQILLLYPGVHALINYRIAHFFWKIRLRLIAEIISYYSRMITGIEIHPQATIGKKLFIDHGMGTVIGASSIIGDNVTMYHGVTIGGRGQKTGKRHPTIGNNVLVGANATILGNITIGDHAKIGANSLVIRDVQPSEVVVACLRAVSKD